ncbi:uncharacterized protein LOC143239188 isoform X2 [Tachypleus tridentatus]|uniref:uncharacterized protein LOC143239188 isoform X2 n=1 Tax=Tachypleus tridentatus TaxID=6853 RepID=UPI003FD37A64
MTFLWTAVIKLPVIPFLSSKSAIMFDPLFVIGENNSYGQVVRGCWLIFSAVVSTTYFRNCWKWRKFDEFFFLWEELLHHNNFSCTAKLKFYRRQLILVTLGVLTCVSVTVCFFIFALLPVVVEHYSNALIISVIFSVIQLLFISGVCVSSVVFFVLISLALKSRFNDISTNFEKCFNHTNLHLDNPDLLISGLLQHQQLCNLVELADDIVRPHTCIALTVCIPIICLSLFDLFFVSLTILQRIIKVVDVMASLTMLGVVTITASSLSTAVMIFAQIFGGPSLGLTCLNLFVVTKSTILNMFSVLVSYFVILVQLHPHS